MPLATRGPPPPLRGAAAKAALASCTKLSCLASAPRGTQDPGPLPWAKLKELRCSSPWAGERLAGQASLHPPPSCQGCTQWHSAPRHQNKKGPAWLTRAVASSSALSVGPPAAAWLLLAALQQKAWPSPSHLPLCSQGYAVDEHLVLCFLKGAIGPLTFPCLLLTLAWSVTAGGRRGGGRTRSLLIQPEPSINNQNRLCRMNPIALT